MSQIMEEFYDGPHATPPVAETGPIYLGIKNITEGGALDLSDPRFINENDFSRWTRRVTPRPGDVVFVYEATLHRYALIPEGFRGCLGRRIALIRPNQALVIPKFLHLAMLGPEWRSTINDRIISGSTVDRIPILDFPRFPIWLPDLRTQERVVGVLGAMDDLIENCRRRVGLLEEMAQAIYREWFVHFRYPGHEHDPLVDSPLGPIPSGWKTTNLGNAGRWLSGGTPSTSNAAYWGGETPWITSGSLTSTLLHRSERRVTVEGLASGTRLVQRDTVLFVVRGMSLVREFRVGIADVPLAFGQDCKAIVARPGIEPIYLGLALISMANEIQSMVELAGHGTGKLSTDRLQAVEIVEPSMPVQRDFAATIQPIRSSMSTIRDQADRLTEIRDLLLPWLVTGKIDVSTLDLDSVLEGAVG
jgi:type I restriction enzyme S subunit